MCSKRRPIAEVKSVYRKLIAKEVEREVTTCCKDPNTSWDLDLFFVIWWVVSRASDGSVSLLRSVQRLFHSSRSTLRDLFRFAGEAIPDGKDVSASLGSLGGLGLIEADTEWDISEVQPARRTACTQNQAAQ